MNVNGTWRIIPRSTLFFYVNVVRSIGQVDELELDEMGQRVLNDAVRVPSSYTC